MTERARLYIEIDSCDATEFVIALLAAIGVVAAIASCVTRTATRSAVSAVLVTVTPAAGTA